MLGTLDVFHFGVVVPDIEMAMAEFGRRFSLTWAPLQERDQKATTGGGEQVSEHIRFTYSVQGTPHLELVQSTDARLWRAGVGELHHIGVFADDLVAESARLAAEGSPLDFCGGHTGQPVGFAYHLVPGDLRLEVVDGTRREQFARWMAGGAL